MEEQDLNTESVVELELEEDGIPNEESLEKDGGLGDVVPCDYVAVEQSENESYDMAGTSNGFYDDSDSVAPSVSSDQMVDIVSTIVDNSENELEEVEIPNEENTTDDEQLDDVA